MRGLANRLAMFGGGGSLNPYDPGDGSLVAMWDGILSENKTTGWKDVISGYQFSANGVYPTTPSDNSIKFVSSEEGIVFNTTPLGIADNGDWCIQICHRRTEETGYNAFISSYPIGERYWYDTIYGLVSFSNPTAKGTLTANLNFVDGTNRHLCEVFMNSVSKGSNYSYVGGIGDVLCGIGSQGPISGYFIGDFFAVRIYNRVLTTNEISLFSQYDSERFNLT